MCVPSCRSISWKTRFFCILFGACILVGCRVTGRLYPVQGPLSAQTPTPVLLARLTGAFSSGGISVVLPDGEVCKGRWATERPVQVPKGAAIASATPNDMASVWDTVYGAGFYVSHILGTRLYVRTVISGDRGTILNLEMYRSVDNEQHAGPIKGVA